MRRVLLGLVCGIALASTAHGAEPLAATRLNEVMMESGGHHPLAIPRQYGRLVNVVASAEVHYLYFEDPAGTIRVVLIGQPGAISHARQPLQLLSPIVTFIERGTGTEEAGS